MLNNSNLVALIATSKPVEAKVFYDKILGLDLLSDDDFAIVFDANGVMLRVQKVIGHAPPPHTVLGWSVTDINSSVKLMSANGVAFEFFDGLEQDDMSIWVSPGGAKIAWFKDPDGNLLLESFPGLQILP